MNCFKFASVINNTTIINHFNSDNSYIIKIKTEHCQIMTTITNIILKFKPMTKKPIVANHTFPKIARKKSMQFTSLHHLSKGQI